MLYFVYDGSFPGLLTAIYEAFYNSQAPDEIIREEHYSAHLFSQKKEIATNQVKSDKVYQGIQTEVSNYTLTSVYYAYLSEVKRMETTIYNYLQLAFKHGAKVNKLHSNSTVDKIKSIRKKVGREAHKMKGLLRFRTLDNGIYYAPLEPDYNIISILARHFSRRLADQNWIIHDLNRRQAAVYNQEEWQLTPLTEQEVEVSTQEVKYQTLWKEFFSSTAVENRTNLKLQQQNMPKKYWKHLVEKE